MSGSTQLFSPVDYAFPFVVQRQTTDGLVLDVSPGMTLRDYFAAKFMAARLANPVSRVDVTDEQMAQNAYARADAMLKAREGKP